MKQIARKYQFTTIKTLMIVCLMWVAIPETGMAKVTSMPCDTKVMQNDYSSSSKTHEYSFFSSNNGNFGIVENERIGNEQDTFSRNRTRVINNITIRFQRNHYRLLVHAIKVETSRRQNYFSPYKKLDSESCISDYYIFTLMQLLL